MAVLLSNPNGRYVLTGILMVAGLIVLWIIFLSVQVLLVVDFSKSKPTVLQNPMNRASSHRKLDRMDLNFSNVTALLVQLLITKRR